MRELYLLSKEIYDAAKTVEGFNKFTPADIYRVGSAILRQRKQEQERENKEKINKEYIRQLAGENKESSFITISCDKIDTHSFEGFNNLEKVEIDVPIIDACAFRNCKNLKEVTLSKRVKVIWNMAFMGCENLSKINFPKGLERIGEGAFQNCVNLPKHLIFPTTMKRIDPWAFLESSVKRVTFKLDPRETFGDGVKTPEYELGDIEVDFKYINVPKKDLEASEKRRKDFSDSLDRLFKSTEKLFSDKNKKSLIKKSIQNNTSTVEKTESTEETKTKDDGLTQ